MTTPIADLPRPASRATALLVGTLRYLDLGIELGVASNDDFGVVGFTIFRARR